MFSKSNNNDQQDYKQKRQEHVVKIRQDFRQKEFQKKRAMNNNTNNVTTFQSSSGRKILVVDQNYKQQIEQFIKTDFTMEQFNDLISNIYNEDIIRRHYGLIGIRKLISIEEDAPIQQVIDVGLVPTLIEYMSQTKYPQLQLEATWALTNVASGTTLQTQSIIDKGGIPLFIKLLSENRPGIAEQAVWAIGNIAGDCTAYRDTILKAGGLQPLIRVVENTTDKVLIKQGSWALSNLCRGSPLPKYETVKAAVTTLCKVIKLGVVEDKDILSDCCWAISYLTQGQKSKIQRVVETGVVPAIVKLSTDSFPSLIIPAVRILGNIVTGNQLQTQQVLKAGGLDALQALLEHHKKTVRRQACWVISNITAGTRAQIEQAITREKMIEKVLRLFESDSSEVKKQICWIFANMSHLGQPNTIFELYRKYSIIRYYVNLLFSDDHKVIETTLECLFTVLSVGEKVRFGNKNPLVEDLLSNGAADILEKLQYHESDAVYSRVIKILQRYFEMEDPLDF